MANWTEIRFMRGFSEFCAAWRNNSGAFLAAGEVMHIGRDFAETTMPRKHIRRFLRECAPDVRVTLFEGSEPEIDE